MATLDVTPTQRRSCRLRRRVATLFVLSVVALCALALADSAWASGSDPSSDPFAGLPNGAATTDQGTSATPADSQDPASAAQAALNAATQQTATAVANANQNAQNIVVIIRINSPGDDVINQSNTAIANAIAANTSTTNQNQGSGGGSADSDTGQPDGTADTSAPSSTPPTALPAQGESAPAAPSAATAPPVTAAPPANKAAAPGHERARPRAFAAAPRSSGGRPHASSTAAAPTNSTRSAAASSGKSGAGPGQQFAPREAASAVPRSTSAPRAGERTTTSVTWAPARADRAAAGAGAGAAHLLSSFSRPPALPSISAGRADQVSTVVVVTLLAVLIALLLGVGSTYVPSVRAWAGR
jgi:hypothetical protein